MVEFEKIKITKNSKLLSGKKIDANIVWLP